jgi:hypothetical protein
VPFPAVEERDHGDVGGDEPDEDWTDFSTAVFHPLADENADLARRLATRFRHRLTVGMSPTEQRYAEEWPEARFEVGTTPKGKSLLAIEFAGGRSATEWSGSEADAEEIVDSCAAVRGDDSIWDYWVQGRGWKEWTGRPESAS